MIETIEQPTGRNFGLVPRPIPASHPKTHIILGSIAQADIPDHFVIPDIVGPVDQVSTDFCTAYTTRELCSDLDGVVYDENWNVATTGKIVGSPILGGTSAQDAMRAPIVYGSLKVSEAPAGMTWEQKGPAFIADADNWPPPTFLYAAKHEQVASLVVDGPYDAFDNLRSAMVKNNRSVGLATKWYFSSFNNIGPSGLITSPLNPNDPSFSYHMYTAKELDIVNGNPVVWMKPYEGAGYGRRGMVAFDRATINALYGPLAFGSAFMYGNVPPSILQRMEDEAATLEQIFLKLVQNL